MTIRFALIACLAALPLVAGNIDVSRQTTVFLNTGDVLLMFSDGVTEACQPGKDEEFGEDRLAALASELRKGPAEAAMRSIIDTLTKWIGDAPAADDITLIVVKKTAG